MNAPMNNPVNAPMILPWLARKWGVSDARALKLWEAACRDAEATTGERGSPRYWGIAKERLLDRLDMEVVASYPATEMPWIMIRLNILRFVAAIRYWVDARKQRFVPPLSA